MRKIIIFSIISFSVFSALLGALIFLAQRNFSGLEPRAPDVILPKDRGIKFDTQNGEEMSLGSGGSNNETLKEEKDMVSGNVISKSKEEEMKSGASALPSGIQPQSSSSSREILNPAASSTNEDFDSIIESQNLVEKEIDIRTVVLVKCTFVSQYFASSSQPWNEKRFTLGSGVVVSSNGYLLTAAHILRPEEAGPSDAAGRVWKRQGCEVARTDLEQTPIPAVKIWGMLDDERFAPAEIVFEPDEEEYRGAEGIDFALLKIKESGAPFVSLVEKFIKISPSAKIVSLGYPGKESTVPQSLERFDGEFVQATFFPNSSCDGSLKPCGLRYEMRRSVLKYQKDFWKKTPLGIVSPYARKGFSGAPAFLKGNLIGIITHGISGQESGDNWDKMFILTSYDISETLKAHSISF